MMTLIAFDDPGLVVLPYHRNLSGLSPEQLERVRVRPQRTSSKRRASLSEMSATEIAGGRWSSSGAAPAG